MTYLRAKIIIVFPRAILNRRWATLAIYYLFYSLTPPGDHIPAVGMAFGVGNTSIATSPLPQGRREPPNGGHDCRNVKPLALYVGL